MTLVDASTEKEEIEDLVSDYFHVADLALARSKKDRPDTSAFFTLLSRREIRLRERLAS